MKPSILVIGSTNADMIIRLPVLPAKGETVTDGEFLQTFGGKGANQAVAAARAGGRVAFLACVGRDAPGDAMIANFQRDGIDTDGVYRTLEAPSGAALVMFDGRGENYLAVAPGANYRITPEHIDAAEDRIAQAAMIVMQMEIPVPAILRALALAKRHATPVLFNYAPVRTRDVPLSSDMGVLVVNEVEAEALSGRPVGTVPEAMAAAETLRAMGPGRVVVTLGKQGSCASTDEGSFHVPTPSVDAVDSTGAGDTFCGALAVALAEGASLLQSMAFATMAAAISVTRIGAQPSIPGRDEIRTKLDGGIGI